MTTATPVTAGRRERAIINLLSSAVAWGWPVLLAFATTPYLIHGLGDDAYGLRGLVLTISGYFALLDLGLNGAVTKYVAEYHAAGETDRLATLIGTTLTTYGAMGLVGGVGIWLLAPWLAGHLFTIPAGLLPEGVLAFRLTGLGFLLSMLMWWATAIPTGLQRFDMVNGIAVAYGTVTTLGGVAAVWLGKGLTGVVIANLLATGVALTVYAIAFRSLLPTISIRPSFDRAMFRQTVAFGIYMVGFRLFALLFSQLDNVLIGSRIGAATLTFYLVPMQIASTIQGFNGKMMEFIFPMASELARTGDARQMETLFLRGFNLSLVIAFAAGVPLAVAGEPLLRFWVSPEMAARGSGVLLLLVVASALGGLSALPANILGGLDYPQGITGGAVVSGLCGLAAYSLLIGPYGIEGVAAGKAFSVILTIAYYLAIVRWKAPFTVGRLAGIAARLGLIATTVGFAARRLLTPHLVGLPMVFAALVLVAGSFLVACWVLGALDPQEKQSILAVARRAWKGGFA